MNIWASTFCAYVLDMECSINLVRLFHAFVLRKNLLNVSCSYKQHIMEKEYCPQFRI